MNFTERFYVGVSDSIRKSSVKFTLLWYEHGQIFYKRSIVDYDDSSQRGNKKTETKVLDVKEDFFI